MSRPRSCLCGSCARCIAAGRVRRYRATLPPKVPPGYVRLVVAAEQRHYSTQQLRRFIRRGVLPAVRVGGARGHWWVPSTHQRP